MALKKIVLMAALFAGVQAFASSRVEDSLTLNVTPKKAEKSKKQTKMIDALDSSDLQKTELPKNARHDATAGVFI